MTAKLVQIAPHTIDDFGDIVQLRDAFAPTERQYQKLRAELAAQCVSADPTAEFLVRGERYTLRISACSLNRSVDLIRAKKKLGVEKFLECCTVSLKALSLYLTGPEVEALTITEQSGSRSYSPIPISTERMP